MKYFLAFCGAFFLVSCAPPIEVSQFHLRDESTRNQPVPMIKAEANFRYDHNLEKADRKLRHGHYYVIRWNNNALTSKGLPLTVKFSYRQADQGRESRVLTQTISPREMGKVEFQVISHEYQKSGRILAWRAELIQEGKVLASEESFLWN